MAKALIELDLKATCERLDEAVEKLELNYTVYTEAMRSDERKIYVDITGLMGNRLMTCEFNLNARAEAILGVLENLDEYFGGVSE